MTDQANLESARTAYAAFGAGDMATLGDLFADDIVWHSAGDNILSGEYVGKEAVFGLFGQLAQETGGSFRNDIHDILANDRHGVALVTSTAARGGKTLNSRAVRVFHMSDGKLAEFWNFPEDPAHVDDFWA
jgi:ketosteroid isomerase-like protein